MCKFPTSCQTIYKERLYIKTYIVNNLFTIMTKYVNSNIVLYNRKDKENKDIKERLEERKEL